MKIGRHFTLAEMTRSPTARALGIKNTPPADVVERLRALVVNVLDPLRDGVGRPISVNSGYRAPGLNLRVGGASNSQHVLGEAADIEATALSTADLARKIVALRLPFDQLILEHHDPDVATSGWVHVSHRASGVQRGELLRAYRDGQRTVYVPWAP